MFIVRYGKVRPGVLCLIVGGREGSPNLGKQVEAVRRVVDGAVIGSWRISLDDSSPSWLVKGNPDVQTFTTPYSLTSNPGFRTMTLNGEVVALVKERNLLPITPPSPELQVTSIKKLKVPNDATELDVT